ncbi:MAG: hypothetical protein A2148_09410 [Chloroflexi bacterium RBG_16_68_14]|nr:MAG: hypothetical protein A2148_09410 [Chloroflexi bacterium RBG_16_68_14]
MRWYAHDVVAQSSPSASLLQEVRGFVSPAQASALLRRAGQILGVDTAAAGHRDELMSRCRALAGEGDLVQEMAEEIARELASR